MNHHTSCDASQRRLHTLILVFPALVVVGVLLPDRLWAIVLAGLIIASFVETGRIDVSIDTDDGQPRATPSSAS